MAETCTKCGSPTSAVERHCPTCGSDLGAPNVRVAGSIAERVALTERARASTHEAAEAGRESDVDRFREAVSRGSHVVVGVPMEVARRLLEDPRSTFANYEQLVGQGARVAALLENDRRRRAVVGLVFGSYGDRIRYGALALGLRAPSGYGVVSFRLRDVAISERVSFLELNSYSFVEAHDLTPAAPFPVGYQAVWDNRQELAVAKLATRVLAGQHEDDWQDLLVQPAVGDRAADCIEAHIYGTFTAHAFDAVDLPEDAELDAWHRVDAAIIRELFRKARSTEGAL